MGSYPHDVAAADRGAVVPDVANHIEFEEALALPRAKDDRPPDLLAVVSGRGCDGDETDAGDVPARKAPRSNDARLALCGRLIFLEALLRRAVRSRLTAKARTQTIQSEPRGVRPTCSGRVEQRQEQRGDAPAGAYWQKCSAMRGSEASTPLLFHASLASPSLCRTLSYQIRRDSSGARLGGLTVAGLHCGTARGVAGAREPGESTRASLRQRSVPPRSFLLWGHTTCRQTKPCDSCSRLL